MSGLAELLGESPGMVAVREKIERLIHRQSESSRLPPVLILGETGTGKGLLARALHGAGPRAAGPFVDVNCAAIPETLLEAELFGFERGAFTDARQAKPGLFQTAHRGTIFLDEIGLLPEALQGKLLKVIEDRAVRRLGSTRSEPVDVWVVAATSEDLEAAAGAQRFRKDLYHRLAVLPVWLPPLRDRGEDIVLLAEHFLAQACAEYRLSPKALSPEARAALVAYRWPGNVRELSNTLERVALLSEGPLVTPALLDLPAGPSPRAPAPGAASSGGGSEVGALKDLARSTERERLLDALRQAGGNITRAAALLGVPRNTLRYRIESHGLHSRGAVPTSRRPGAEPPAEIPAAPTPVPVVAPPPAGIRWERRHLALLGAAVVAPSTFSLPDTSRAVEVLAEKVHAFGGRVEELGPTGLMAVFGLEPVEDAPRRAAHAAMTIQKAIERSRRAGAEAIGVRIGIHVDPAMVGRIGGTWVVEKDAKQKAGAALDALAARAAPGTVLVSEAAARFLERRFELTAAPASGAMREPAYRIVGPERSGLGQRRRMPRFVGRRQELDLLESRLALALGGHGQAVGIAGEAGIGKTRLLFEFRRHLRGKRVTYLQGHCLSFGSATPYLPVVESLRDACRIAETDGADAIAEKVGRNLSALGLDAGEAAPFLLRLLGARDRTDRLAALSPESVQARTFDLLRQMSLKGSRQRPLILAVEDAHWIDKTSETFLASLAENLAGAPLLLLVTYRPGYRPPWMDKSYATQIALPPLSSEDSLSVVHSVRRAEPVSDALTRLILAKAEGNPFFLEELTRAVGEHGDRPSAPAVPDTIQEVLRARIERLSDEPKRVLQIASVLGREFSVRLLDALPEAPRPLGAPLQELTRLEFLYERGGAEEPVYVFRHAITREVAYETLLPHQRTALHAAAGRALETLHAGRLEDVDDLLAFHYSRAEEAGKAVGYLTRFAEKAARHYAHVEAAAALQEALAHADRLPDQEREHRRLGLILRLTSSLYFLGRFRETRAMLLENEERLERLGAPALAGPYYFLLGRTYGVLGEREQATRSAERALGEAERCGDTATMGRARWVLALEGCWSGRLLEGIAHGRQAVALLEQTEERWWLGMAHWVLAFTYVLLGEFEPALRATAQADALGAALEDPRLQSYAAWTTGSIYAFQGDHEAGIATCQRAIERSPDPLNTAYALGLSGRTYVEKGDSARAIPLLEQSVQRFEQFRHRPVHGWFTVYLSEAYLLDGQVEKARDLAIQGLEITREVEFRYGVGWAQRALGRIARARGVRSDAHRHFNDALGTFASIHSRFELARTHLDLAELAQAGGEADAVAVNLRAAHALFAALGIPRYVERAGQQARERGIRLEPPSGPAAGT